MHASQLDALRTQTLPHPGEGHTAERHLALARMAEESLSYARIAEAHFDALSILHEAGLSAAPSALYGVWASEHPAAMLQLCPDGSLCGSKRFCSGAELVDRALVTVKEAGATHPILVEVDLRSHGDWARFDASAWITEAFRDTNTATTTFDHCPIARTVGDRGWYLARPGFWHGACGPAACWAGGSLALVQVALAQTRDDPHTTAHKGAVAALGWNLQVILTSAGHEIDASPADAQKAHIRALSVRHLVESACSEILSRFGRAFGPHPLAFDARLSRLSSELTLYLRQSHAERDLASLGHAASNPARTEPLA